MLPPSNSPRLEKGLAAYHPVHIDRSLRQLAILRPTVLRSDCIRTKHSIGSSSQLCIARLLKELTSSNGLPDFEEELSETVCGRKTQNQLGYHEVKLLGDGSGDEHVFARLRRATCRRQSASNTVAAQQQACCQPLRTIPWKQQLHLRAAPAVVCQPKHRQDGEPQRRPAAAARRRMHDMQPAEHGRRPWHLLHAQHSGHHLRLLQGQGQCEGRLQPPADGGPPCQPVRADATYADAARGLVRVVELAAVHAVCMPQCLHALQGYATAGVSVPPLSCRCPATGHPGLLPAECGRGEYPCGHRRAVRPGWRRAALQGPVQLVSGSLSERVPFGFFQEGKIAVAASVSRLSSSLGMAIGLQCPIERSERMLRALQVH